MYEIRKFLADIRLDLLSIWKDIRPSRAKGRK